MDQFRLANTRLANVATSDLDRAQRWFSEFEGAGLGKRIMFTIKHGRRADRVVRRAHRSRRRLRPLVQLGIAGLAATPKLFKAVVPVARAHQENHFV